MSYTKIVLSVLCALAVISILMVGCPSYNVYVEKMKGEAILAHAQASREVAVVEAKAKMESSAMLAQADTFRAHGVARSNIIIGESLTEKYLHWYFIDKMDMSKSSVIYIPTETGIPILEAGKRDFSTKEPQKEE